MKLAVESPVSDVTVEGLIDKVKSNRVFYQDGYAQAELDLKREPLSDERELLKQLHVGRVVEYHRPHYPNNILYVHVVRFKEACGWTLGTGIVVNNLGREHTISLEEIRL